MLILWSKSQFDILTFSTSNLRFIVLFCGLSTGWWLKTSTNSFKNALVREKIVDKVIVKNQFDLLRTVRVESILITRCFLVIKMKKKSAPGEIRTKNRKRFSALSTPVSYWDMTLVLRVFYYIDKTRFHYQPKKGWVVLQSSLNPF